MNENSVELAKHTFPEDRLPSRAGTALVGSKVLPPQAQQLFLLLFCGPVCAEMSAISFPFNLHLPGLFYVVHVGFHRFR